jgi:hypothetical protein
MEVSHDVYFPLVPVGTRLLWARGVRALADGFISLLLPVYLGVLGMSSTFLTLLARSAALPLPQ